VYPQEDRSQEDVWRDSLRFGIDTSVVATIDEIENARETRLVPEFKEVFPGARAAVQTRIIDYFLKMELSELVEEVENEILFYQDLSVPLVQKMMEYLRAYPPEDQKDYREILLEMAEGTNFDLASAALRSLGAGRMVEDGTFFREIFKKDNQTTGVRIGAIEALAQYDDQETIDFLHDLAENEAQEQLLRQTAIRSLGKISSEQSLGLFRRLLDSTDPFIRTAVLESLGSYSADDTTTVYRNALRDSFWRIRLSVLRSLAENPIDDLEDMVIYIARNDPEVPVRTQAYRTLGAYDTPRAWEAIETDSASTKVGEAYRLLLLELVVRERYAQNKTTIDTIIEAEWTKENSRILDIIGRNLSTLTTGDGVEVFERFLGHSNLIIKIYGIRGLGNANAREYRDRLETLAEDGNPAAIRQNAQEVLDRW